FFALQNGNRLLIGKRAGSSPITLATKSFTFSTGTFVTLRLDANGSTLTGFVNGTRQLTASDSEFTARIISRPAHLSPHPFSALVTTTQAVAEAFAQSGLATWAPLPATRLTPLLCTPRRGRLFATSLGRRRKSGNTQRSSPAAPLKILRIRT